MKIYFSFVSPDYGRAAELLMPLLRERIKDDGSFLSRLSALALSLPSDKILPLINALTTREKDGLLSMAVEEYEDKLAELCNKLLRQEGLELAVKDISLSRELEGCISLCDINYLALARRFLPMVPGAVLKDSPLSMLAGLPAKLLYTALEKLPHSRLEQAAVYLINKSNFKIIDKIEALAESKGFRISLTSLSAEI